MLRAPTTICVHWIGPGLDLIRPGLDLDWTAIGSKLDRQRLAWIRAGLGRDRTEILFDWICPRLGWACPGLDLDWIERVLDLVRVGLRATISLFELYRPMQACVRAAPGHAEIMCPGKETHATRK